MRQSFLSFHQWRCLVFANLDKIPQLKADSSQKRKTQERIPAFPYTSQAQAGTACRGFLIGLDGFLIAQFFHMLHN